MTISFNLKSHVKQTLLISLSIIGFAFTGNGFANETINIDSLPRPTLPNYPVNGRCQLNQQGFVDMPAYQTLQNIKYRRALLSYGMRYAGSSAATSDFRCADLGLIAALWQSAIGSPVTGLLSQSDATAFARAVDGMGSAYAQARPVYQPQTQSLQPGADIEVEMYRRLAEAGDAKAQFRLGAVYESRQNYQEAAKWYQLSANQGETLGINALNGLKQKNNNSYSELEFNCKEKPSYDNLNTDPQLAAISKMKKAISCLNDLSVYELMSRKWEGTLAEAILYNNDTGDEIKKALKKERHSIALEAVQADNNCRDKRVFAHPGMFKDNSLSKRVITVLIEGYTSDIKLLEDDFAGNLDQNMAKNILQTSNECLKAK